MNRDFVEILSELSAAGADFLVVGAHALAVHGVPRATGDLDIWVRPTPGNAARVLEALHRFGAPLSDLSGDDLTRSDTVFQMCFATSRHMSHMMSSIPAFGVVSTYSLPVAPPPSPRAALWPA